MPDPHLVILFYDEKGNFPLYYATGLKEGSDYWVTPLTRNKEIAKSYAAFLFGLMNEYYYSDSLY